MTTPRGEAPLTETGPKGRGQAKPAARGRRPKAADAQAVEEHPRPAQPAEPRENLADTAAQLAGGAEGAEAVLGSGLLAGSGLGPVAGALRSLGQVAMRQPQALLRSGPKVGLQFLQIGLGKSEVAPEKGDKRFADPAWRDNPLFRTTMQAYLALGSELDVFIDNLGLEGVEAERMRFAATLFREAMAPTNFLVTNPTALKRLFDTSGGSIRKGIAHWAGDMLNNHGMPSMVDLRPFKKGENIAVSAGAVIHRTEVFELIQYTPQTETVCQRPLIVVPPQVNKYYALDMSPGRSMYEYLLQHGIQLFGMSWRNPTGEQRQWNFDTYAQATIEAVDVAREVSGSPDVNIIGACLGGMTAAIVQAHLSALGDDRIHSTTFMVTLLDTESEGRMFLFATPQTIALARKVSEPRGVIDGWQMASMFSWLRPNDLVLELLGEQLPAGPGPSGLRHPGLERGHHPADFGLPPPATRHGGGQPAGASGGPDGPWHADRHIPHYLRHVRGRRVHRPHHAVEDRLPDHPDGLRSSSVRHVLERPHPDRGGRPEAPGAGVLPQPEDAARP